MAMSVGRTSMSVHTTNRRHARRGCEVTVVLRVTVSMIGYVSVPLSVVVGMNTVPMRMMLDPMSRHIVKAQDALTGRRG